MPLEYLKNPTVFSLARRISHNDTAAQAGVLLGTVPLGAVPCGASFHCSWEFNGSGAYSDVGFTNGTREWARFLDLTAGLKTALQFADLTVIPLGANREVWARLRFTTAPTQGWGVLRIDYTY
jgi:hypothetical protein